MKKNNSHGYILIFTLLVIAAAMTVATYVSHRGAIYVPFIQTSIAREKAKLLALSGIEIAKAQLGKKPQEKKKENKSAVANAKQKNAAQEKKDFLKNILPSLNRMQTFVLKEEVDGIDAQIQVCIMCEEGKININRVYDFYKKQFIGEKEEKEKNWKVIIQEIFKSIEKTTKAKELFPAFEKFLKKREFKCNDPTELMMQKEFDYFKDALFYEPSLKKEEKETKRPIYLTDIFTVWSSSDKIEPWLFSDSINAVFNLPRAQEGEIKKRKESVAKWVENFKEKVNWQQDWKAIMMPIYGKELRSLPKNIDSMLSTTFEQKIFSVLAYGKVGEIIQRVFAIVERKKQIFNDDIEYDVVLKKLYWL